VCLALRYLADHANHVELRDGRCIHDGLDCAAYLNEFADALYQVTRQAKIRAFSP
jgi:hypothetical protein